VAAKEQEIRDRGRAIREARRAREAAEKAEFDSVRRTSGATLADARVCRFGDVVAVLVSGEKKAPK
jgi:hypothetical protein